MQDPASPTLPSTEPTQPETPPTPAPYPDTPITPIAGDISSPAPDPNSMPAPVPDLIVPAPQQFPNGDNMAASSPIDPPVMVRGETTIPQMSTAASTGVTTATILPVGSGGADMVSYPSSGGTKRFLLPLIIGILLLLAILGGAYVFFRSADTSGTEEASVSTPASEIETSSPTVEPTTDLPTIAYENIEFGFSIDYPQDWAFKENVNGNVVVFSDPTTTVNPSKVSVLAETTLEDVTTYGEGLQRIYSQLYTDWVNVNTTPTTIGTLEAIEVESTYTKGAVNMQVLQLIVVNGGKAFVITSEAEETAFLDLRETFTQILASLKFTS
jgi:hypothetical protein